MHDKYIIVGCCARCGSVYMSEVLCQLGLKMGHEKPDNDGVVGWQHLISTDSVRRKAIEMAAGREIVYLMQVRHPVPTITSMATLYKSGYWPTFYDKDPLAYLFQIEAAGNEGPIINAMQLYYHLNNMGELGTHWRRTYQIEAIDVEWPAIAALIGIPGVELPIVPRNINTRPELEYMDLAWCDIYAAHPGYGQAIARMADRWGYDVSDCGKRRDTIDLQCDL